jgi:hypothetical protein
LGLIFYFCETVETRDRFGCVGCVLDIYVNILCYKTSKFLYHQVLEHIYFLVHDPKSLGNRIAFHSTRYPSNYNTGPTVTMESWDRKWFTFAL